MRPERIISGGQTGADQAGLSAAKEMGIPTGGTASKGWRTEDGPAPWLADYGLVENDRADYWTRTVLNVVDSDGTVIFGDIESTGSRLTLRQCSLHNRHVIVNPDAQWLWGWVELHDIKVLNVAGNRASKAPELAEHVRAVLLEAFGADNEAEAG